MSRRQCQSCIAFVLVLLTQFLAPVKTGSVKLHAVKERPVQPEDPALLYVPQHPICARQNLPLKKFLHKQQSEDAKLLPSQASSLDEFVHELKEGLEAKHLDRRALHYVFSDLAEFHPTCSGLWLEFGVFEGVTINTTATFREHQCSQACPAVHGFDTFTGLPEGWDIGGGADNQTSPYSQGIFSKQGILPSVRDNVNLVQGLFNQTLPSFLDLNAAFAGQDQVVSYLHIDCDLYSSTRDIFRLLESKLVVGSVIVFDELLNYQNYKEHEVKAFWEFLQETDSKVVPLGIYGPLKDRKEAIDLEWSGEPAPHASQSAAFVIAYQRPRSH